MKATDKKLRIAGTAIGMVVLTFTGKALGFARELVMAACFGTSYVTDAYVMARSIPDILFSGIVVAVGTSFVPLYADQNVQYGKEKADSMFNSLLNLLIKVAVPLSILGILLADPLISIFANGFFGEQRSLAVFFLRITFISVGFTGLNQLYSSYLNFNEDFISPIVCGYCFNIFSCIFALIASKYTERILPFGCVMGYALTTLLLSGTARRKGMVRNFFFREKTDSIALKVFKLSLPVFVGEYAHQINFYIDRFLSSGMQQGSVASLNYAYEIITLITGVTTVVITTIAFSKMNQERAGGDIEKYNDILQKSFLISVIIAMPCMFGVFAFSREIVQAIYGRGAFDSNSVSYTSKAVFWYAPYLLAFAMSTPIIQAFQSHKSMKTPMIIGLISMLCNVVLSIVLSGIIGMGGLALATSVSMIITVTIGWIELKKSFPDVVPVKDIGKIMRIAVISLATIGTVYLLNSFILSRLSANMLFRMIILVIISSALYLVLLRLFNIVKYPLRGNKSEHKTR